MGQISRYAGIMSSNNVFEPQYPIYGICGTVLIQVRRRYEGASCERIVLEFCTYFNVWMCSSQSKITQKYIDPLLLRVVLATMAANDPS